MLHKTRKLISKLFGKSKNRNEEKAVSKNYEELFIDDTLMNSDFTASDWDSFVVTSTPKKNRRCNRDSSSSGVSSGGEVSKASVHFAKRRTVENKLYDYQTNYLPANTANNAFYVQPSHQQKQSSPLSSPQRHFILAQSPSTRMLVMSCKHCHNIDYVNLNDEQIYHQTKRHASIKHRHPPPPIRTSAMPEHHRRNYDYVTNFEPLYFEAKKLSLV